MDRFRLLVRRSISDPTEPVYFLAHVPEHYVRRLPCALGVIYAPCVAEVAVSGVLAHLSAVGPLGVLAGFRRGFCDCLYAREDALDALFELADALLRCCAAL